MLESLKPDMVSVCGPFEAHAHMCIEAFRRNIHVFSEKPVATTLQDLGALQNAYAKAEVQFTAMMGLRYSPAFYTAWQAVRDGAIGTVRLISARKSSKLGARAQYYRQRHTYGGTIPWLGSHVIDWISWFSGESFRSVYATHSTRENRDHGDLEVSALCHFTLTNQVFASASIDYLRPTTAPTHADDRVRVAGTEGVIEVRGGEVLLIHAGGDGEQRLTPACDRQIFRDFVEQIEGKTISLLCAEDVFSVTEACLLARQSADEGKLLYFHEKG
jgi:predicted dehydrogenase